MKKCEPSACPDPEVLAAFAAGNLSGEELEMTVEHLRECEECRLIVAEAARYDRVAQPKSKVPAWLLAAAAIAGVGYISISMIRSSRANAPMRALVAATPVDGRYVEPRVTGGFPWAPLHSVQRGQNPPEPSQMVLIGEAGKVIARTNGDSSTSARHAAAVARLLTNAPADAAAELSGIAEAAHDAKVWSDLAAARYTQALQSEDPPELAQALTAADAALRIDNKLPEALFNRALILEHLGLRDQARTAWKRYLAVDPASAWSHEAEKHLAGLNAVSDFRRELDRAYAALDSAPNRAALLFERFPQESRVWGESEILSRWARRELAGDFAGGVPHLRLARLLGDELARTRDEQMLREAVAAIDQADGVKRRTLAEGHVALREAQKAYKSEGPVHAQQLFIEAAQKFELGGSPLVRVARYFVANTTFDQGRAGDARDQLEQALSQSRPEFRAYTAQVQWELGMIYAALGRWGQALETLNRSAAGFEALGENNYAMTVREIMAEVYDRIGEPRKAWNHRIVALQELGRIDDLRLQVAIYAIARGAALSHDWAVGLSFLDLQLEMGRHSGDDLMYVHTLLLRASMEGRVGRQSAAFSDLAKATVSMPAIRDVAFREGAEAERLAVEGMLAPSPANAIVALSRAIDFQRTKGRRMFLSELLLQRGRAFAATGQTVQAAGDFETGIVELEKERMSIAPGDERWGMFGAADALFTEAVVLALQRSDTAAAFAYSERGRATELLDSMGRGAASATPAALPDALILEYVQLPDKMIIFVVDGERLRVVKQDVASSVVANEIERFNHSAATGDTAEFRRLASVIYDRLLGPVADELASGNLLVVVPDGSLNMVPFGALIDPAGKYVIERRPVVVAPSVAVLAHGNRSRFRRSPRLLMVAGSASRDGESGRLTAQQREVDSITAEYGHNVEYAPRTDVTRFLEQHESTADVVHFVGHAIIPTEANDGALVLSRQAIPEAQLDVHGIAAMQLKDIRLVVLAACGTARGYGRSGAPSVSLARAFLVAGVPSVLATLWPIDDPLAAEFFPRFHHYLVQGLPPAEALRAVQLEWIHRQDVSPGVWAAVEIIGT